MEAVSDISAFSAVMAGICLSAAAGLRVFIPILALGLAGRFELLPISEQFMWMTSTPVLTIVGLAALMEVGSYYVPLVDNLLDLLATPAAMAGGTVIVSSLLPEMNAAAQWGTAAVLGGGTAGVVQGSTVLARGLSTTSTGGLGNSAVSTGETGGSLLAVVLAIFVPIIFGLIVIALVVWLLAVAIRQFRKPRQQPGSGPDHGEHSPPGP
ncbi:DUF4126 domain-containing protein [Wenzhouxiangella sp. AB-CW3]|uniref:DUF4126 domain-containing protein n=1 Tax=Wenzhouxiangella sp. AB-CW3 TaxID=2771012 RepID=UPI00168B379C|nr:DUF4126 domain-containing protein [Wenzhouxiangella sp. AB-CW3]QOC21092.1 DUF4126 domain-containing protein [Wenzhouxiangella sp. AB-CW3]